MSVFSRPAFDDHELVEFVCDRPTGLRAVIAVHDTAPIGVAGGGCRMWDYASDEAALDDALQLSKVMTYKLALLDLPAGGAKMVILGDSRRDKKDALLAAIGRAIHRLGGRFVASTDVGITPRDLEIIARETPFVSREGIHDGAEATARGVLRSIRWALARHLGRADLHGVRVAVQAVGRVGFALSRHLVEGGARVLVADVDAAAAQRAADSLGVEVVEPEVIHAADVDVLAPCGMGGVIDEASVDRLRCRIVAGAANNPLTRDTLSDALAARGILFVPDFVANLGGVIANSPAPDQQQDLESKLGRLERVLDETASLALHESVTLHSAALVLAKRRIAERRRT